MILVPEILVEHVAASVGPAEIDNIASGIPPRIVETTGFKVRRAAAEGTSLEDMMSDAANKALSEASVPADAIGGIVAATFTAPARMPSLAVRLASALGLRAGAPAIDLSAACSAYPYALYVAGRLAADTGEKVLLLDGDLQSPLVDSSDASTAALFSDAATATIVSSDASSVAKSHFAFLSKASDALECSWRGPLKMDGFKVFSFVAADVTRFLGDFIEEAGKEVDLFVPHEANMYMVRQLAKSLGLSGRLLSSEGRFANPGSASVPLAIAGRDRGGIALLAGYGAGLSASAAIVRIAPPLGSTK